MSEFKPKPVELESETVKLIPMAAEHAAGLFEAGKNPAVWKYLPMHEMDSLERFERLVSEALAMAETAGDVPFVIHHKGDDRLIGSTRYIDVRPEHKGLEIGWTWLDPDYWRSAVNTECKFLLLCHAFDDLGAIRVQLKTDSRNNRSQTAIQRIGAKKEGTLRNHYVMPDGYHRHSVMFSITHKEWKEVKPALQMRLL